VVAPVAEGAIPAHTEEVATPVHATPASHDPREWVARFVGDKGPLQLSSRAVTESTRAPESLEPAAGEAPSPAETPRARRNPSGGAQPHSRSERKGDLRLVTTVSLAAIVIIAAVALVIRTGGLSRSRAGQAEGVATTADSQQDAGKASSSRALKTGASSARAASATRSAERASIGSTARSKRPYTLDVGGYDDLESALDARVRMQDLTGFEGWVVTANEGGVETYRIVLGVYRSHARATAATRMLLDTRTLREVTVVPLPPQSSRQ
jgi:septal ring-binding cell division protein DamX